MNRFFSTATAFAAGMVAMYYFDEQNGRRRRALLGDKARSATRRGLHSGKQEARHLANQARGVAATGNLERTSHRPPDNDWQLHERIRAEMGHVVRHPGAIDVLVRDGRVTLGGDILKSEVGPLLACVRGIAGVQHVDNQLSEHEHPDGISSLQGSGRREPKQSHAGGTGAQAPAGTAASERSWH